MSRSTHPHVLRAWSLIALSRIECHRLAFAQLLEHLAPERAAMHEIFLAIVARDEPEALVNPQFRNLPVHVGPLFAIGGVPTVGSSSLNVHPNTTQRPTECRAYAY